MLPAGDEGEVEHVVLIEILNKIITVTSEDRGSTVVKVLCYKSEGRWFDHR